MAFGMDPVAQAVYRDSVLLSETAKPQTTSLIATDPQSDLVSRKPLPFSIATHCRHFTLGQTMPHRCTRLTAYFAVFIPSTKSTSGTLPCSWFCKIIYFIEHAALR